MNSFFRRVLPAIGLFFLAPLVAEFLLGDFPITMLGILAILAPLYGGGAVLIRESVRRTGRGWPTILALALAYGILEEAFTTETLFNPNYLGLNLHLLDHVYVPALGIGIWWTLFVLTLHTVWSISVPIALVEGLVPSRARAPWLGRVGITVDSVIFVLAAGAMTRFAIKQDRHHFVASPAQFATSAAITVAVAALAFLMPQSSPNRNPTPAPSAWVVGGLALAAGSVFLVIPSRWNGWAVAAYLALDLIVAVVVRSWSRRSGWNGVHRVALAGGAALAYAWHAFLQMPVTGPAGVTDRIGNAVFALGTAILVAVAARRTTAQAAAAGREAPLI